MPAYIVHDESDPSIDPVTLSWTTPSKYKQPFRGGYGVTRSENCAHVCGDKPLKIGMGSFFAVPKELTERCTNHVCPLFY